MIPLFDRRGRLPPGVHRSEWPEFMSRFGGSSYRRDIASGLKDALDLLRNARCEIVYVDGSFVTAKPRPGDVDVCWSVENVDVELLDPVFLDFSDERSAQKARFLGEFFPAELPEGESGKLFLEFFQIDKETGEAKGIVMLDLKDLP